MIKYYLHKKFYKVSVILYILKIVWLCQTNYLLTRVKQALVIPCSTPYHSFMSYDALGHDKTIHAYISDRATPSTRYWTQSGITFHVFRILPCCYHHLEPPRESTYLNVIVSPRDSTLHNNQYLLIYAP